MSCGKDKHLDSALVWGLFLIYALIVLRDAWVGDDVFITLRTVKQWVLRGELGWNPHERVQAYTHPLWMMLLAVGYALTREPYYTTLVISLLVSFGAIACVVRYAKSSLGSMLFLLLLLNSRAYIDYSTSGLENPLTHLLCALVFCVFIRREWGTSATSRWPSHARRVFLLSFLTALVMCNRLDTLLLVAPMAAWASWESMREGLAFRHALAAIALGALPIFAWECFSLVYYGSFIPNTALAKLNTQIPSGELFIQGLNFLYESLLSDHLSLVAILAGLALPLATGQRRHFAIVAGSLLYTLYLLKIGGDFMSGRFLTGPFFLIAALSSQLPRLRSSSVAGIAAAAFLLNLSSPRTTIPISSPQAPSGRIDHRGIADERGFYAGGAGLSNMNRHNDAPHRGSRYDGESLDPSRIHVRGAMGYVGFHASPDTYLVDHWALTDPLVARLPATYHPKWRIGHFSRALPAGYIESLHHNQDRFSNRQIAEFYQHLKRITRGPLWSPMRWRSIWKLQTGQLDHLIPKPFFRYHGAQNIPLKQMQARPRSGATPIKMGVTGIFIGWDGKISHDRLVVLDLDSDDDYRLLFEKHGRITGSQELPRVVPRTKTPIERRVKVREDLAREGYQAIRVIPVRGHEPYQIWHAHIAKDQAAQKALAAELRATQAEAAAAAKAKKEKAKQAADNALKEKAPAPAKKAAPQRKNTGKGI